MMNNITKSLHNIEKNKTDSKLYTLKINNTFKSENQIIQDLRRINTNTTKMMTKEDKIKISKTFKDEIKYFNKIKPVTGANVKNTIKNFNKLKTTINTEEYKKEHNSSPQKEINFEQFLTHKRPDKNLLNLDNHNNIPDYEIHINNSNILKELTDLNFN